VSSFAAPLGKFNLDAVQERTKPGALSDGAPLLCLFGPDAASDKTGVPGIRNELL
jgi:hypothetical protein